MGTVSGQDVALLRDDLEVSTSALWACRLLAGLLFLIVPLQVVGAGGLEQAAGAAIGAGGVVFVVYWGALRLSARDAMANN